VVKSLKFGDQVEVNVATSESWKDKTTGEYKNRTSWHKIICKGDRNTKYASQYLKKGMNVMVEGKQENRTYEIEGKKRVSPEVIVGPYDGTISSTDPKPKTKGDTGQAELTDQKSATPPGDFDDEIPF